MYCILLRACKFKYENQVIRMATLIYFLSLFRLVLSSGGGGGKQLPWHPAARANSICQHEDQRYETTMKSASCCRAARRPEAEDCNSHSSITLESQTFLEVLPPLPPPPARQVPLTQKIIILGNAYFSFTTDTFLHQSI